MAKEQVRFVDVELGSLNAEQRAAWDTLMLAKAGFKATLQPTAPVGMRVVFSDKYNKLKVALVKAAAEAKPAMTLADYLTNSQAAGIPA